MQTSDVSRKKYYIKKEIDDVTSWIADAGGIEFSELSIDILLTRAHERLLQYTQQCTKRINYLHKLVGQHNVDNMGTIVENKTACQNIFIIISKQELHAQILKYVTPYFKLKKEKVIGQI